MKSRNERRDFFENFSDEVNNNLFDNLDWSEAVVIFPENLDKNIKKTQSNKISFKLENVINTIETTSDSCVLVFCSAKNPGGGILQGSKAQEEEISLHSSWYFQIRNIENFYLKKGENAINTDKLLYVKKGFLLKNEYYFDIKPVEVSFIGSTAPNVKGMLEQNFDIANVEDVMRKRVENVLKLAQISRRSKLILGAWGCGIFGLDPVIVAKIFNEKINEGWFSGEIIFSINEKSILEVFENIISNPLKTLKKIKVK